MVVMPAVLLLLLVLIPIILIFASIFVSRRIPRITLFATGSVLVLAWMFSLLGVVSSYDQEVIVVISRRASAFGPVAPSVERLAVGTALWTPSLSEGQDYIVLPTRVQLVGRATAEGYVEDYNLMVVLPEGNELKFIGRAREANLFSPSGGRFVDQDKLEAYLRGLVDGTIVPPSVGLEDKIDKALELRGLSIDRSQSTIRGFLTN